MCFFKKGDIVSASVRLLVMLSPPKQLDEKQPYLVCELLTRTECATSNLLALSPGHWGWV